MKADSQKKDTEKITLRQTLSLNYRAFLLLKKACPGTYLSSFLCAAAGAVSPYVGIWISARILNELAGARDPGRLQSLVLLALASGALLALGNALLNRWKSYCQAPYWYQVNKLYRDKLLKMDFQALDDQKTFELYSQIKQLDQWAGWGLIRIRPCFETLIRCLAGIVSAAALTVSLFTLQVPSSAGSLTLLNHPLAVLAVAVLLAAVTFLSPVCHTRAGQIEAKQDSQTLMENRAFSFYGYMATHDRSRSLDVRIYNQQKICRHFFYQNQFLPGGTLARAAAGPIGLLHTLGSALSVVFTGIIYVFTCLKAWAGAFGVGNVTQYIGTVTALSQNISTLLQTLGEMRSNARFLGTTFAFLDIPNNMYQGSLTTEKRSDRRYQVEFRDVSFKYPGTDTWALRHVSLKFQVGRRLAVVGQNGSGKTTFIKLLCRLYDPTEGQILLNGIDIRKYRYDDYIAISSVVFQDFQLLALPLGQNIAASQDYNRELVEQCLEKSGFSCRLEEMKKGLDTCLYRNFENDGIEVSGGEAQKLAIARALYKDAPFIILDEPTAALDPMAEMEIYQKFDQIAGDKTAVYISHRLSSCRFCDEIVVFDQGRLVQQGTHKGLLSDQEGKYSQLWNAQAQYYQT